MFTQAWQSPASQAWAPDLPVKPRIAHPVCGAEACRFSDMTFQPAPSPPDLTFELPAHITSVGEARRRVRAHLIRQGCGDEACETVVLLVSELVTNAVRHTRSTRVRCSVGLEAGKVRIEVRDQGEGRTPVALVRATDDDVNGRGLYLVAALSQEWGVREHDSGSGCVVWALVSAAD
ncbi:ATP-binding protein [Streptomyces sp. NPDC005648]|uniref:ATP-binding protein n=1 Tax=Streptomyces sp. NPDC005648 TaxID=3157044 RepID=UPI0033B8FC09